MQKVLSGLLALAVTGVLVVVFWPQLFGLQTTWIVAQAVSLRGAVAVATLVLAVIVVGFAAIRRLRIFAVGAASALVLFSLGTGALLGQRGIDNTTLAAPTPQSVTVLAWNTLGDEPGSDAVAALAVESRADIISLPETTEAMGVAVAQRMRERGRPMWVHTTAFDQISPARSTTVLVSPALGDYVKVTSDTERSNNTAVLPTVIVQPVDGNGPTIVAVHAVAPVTGQMANWRGDLSWLAEQCTGPNVIMAGDFNSTIDHMAGLGSGPNNTLGMCADSAQQAGSAAIGTWPTSVPPLLGAPIDHVMATSNWRAVDAHVVDTVDDSGSDHRPVVVRLEPSVP